MSAAVRQTFTHHDGRRESARGAVQHLADEQRKAALDVETAHEEDGGDAVHEPGDIYEHFPRP